MISASPRPVLASLLFACAAALGCSDVGTHSLAIEGSAQTTAGISTADGWSLSVSEFVVVVHNPSLIERSDNEPAWVREAGVTVWDVTQALAEGEALSRKIRATRYDGADFRIAPASASGYEAVAGNVEGSIVDAAVEGDWSIHAVGTATNSTTNQTVSFDWTFDTNTFYRCELEGDAVVELGAEGDETTVLEIYAEALFHEAGSEFNPDADAVFQPIADADADGDGAVTQAELESAGVWASIESLSTRLGGYRGSGYGACPIVEE